jgi:hypothetical protein
LDFILETSLFLLEVCISQILGHVVPKLKWEMLADLKALLETRRIDAPNLTTVNYGRKLFIPPITGGGFRL